MTDAPAQDPIFAFDAYVYDGATSTAETDGFTVTATIHNDDNADAPWEREDGHGPATGWEKRPKLAGELVLNSEGFTGGAKRFYDFAEACKIARRDGWGVEGGKLEGETDRAYAARAAMADFKTLKAWCNDDWRYVGVAVTVERAGVQLVGPYDHALWGCEANLPGSDNSYLAQVAGELLGEALEAARAKLAELAEA